MRSAIRVFSSPKTGRSSMSEPNSARRRAAFTVVAAVFAILMALGTWQIQRRTWKEGVLAAIATGRDRAPATVIDPAVLGCDASKGLLDPCDFRRIRIEGRMTALQEAHVFIAIPRQPNGLQGPGTWAFTVFEPTAGGRIWVNQGFVPEAQKQAAGALRPTDPVVIDGVLRRAEERTRFSATNDLIKNLFFVRAPREFEACCPTCRCAPSAPAMLDYYIDMTGPVPPSGLPYPMAGSLTIPNRHLEYALTWYGLAATWLVIALAALRRRT